MRLWLGWSWLLTLLGDALPSLGSPRSSVSVGRGVAALGAAAPVRQAPSEAARQATVAQLVAQLQVNLCSLWSGFFEGLGLGLSCGFQRVVWFAGVGGFGFAVCGGPGSANGPNST